LMRCTVSAIHQRRAAVPQAWPFSFRRHLN
jgi:hypothetical protein